jgi:hypothetical protein
MNNSDEILAALIGIGFVALAYVVLHFVIKYW